MELDHGLVAPPAFCLALMICPGESGDDNKIRAPFGSGNPTTCVAAITPLISTSIVANGIKPSTLTTFEQAYAGSTKIGGEIIFRSSFSSTSFLGILSSAIKNELM